MGKKKQVAVTNAVNGIVEAKKQTEKEVLKPKRWLLMAVITDVGIVLLTQKALKQEITRGLQTRFEMIDNLKASCVTLTPIKPIKKV